ncbi:MAG: hypothetical protein KAI17_26600, partial [Thiotrichaceae bacterium]|nr:hypothetical protein [Thiotrichaceae bacterium]
QTIQTATSNDRRSDSVSDFSAMLKDQALSGQQLSSHNIDGGRTKDTNIISLGQLDKKNNSVAHLLLANPDLKTKTWSIIHQPINKDKAFQSIPAGSQISYNKATGELSWKQEKISQAAQNNRTAALNEPAKTAAQSTTPPTENKMLLGTLTKQSATVSALLSQHSDFKSQRWNIIYSNINKNKPFTNIPEGAQVYIDKTSKEISWLSAAKNSPVSDNTTIMAHKLDDAVKPYMGTPYKKLDCYTLVVHGLKNMGVNYRGEDSLSRQLLQMARAEGRVDNAYFTGEGITKAIGGEVYSKSITEVQDSNKQSKDIYHEMRELMQKGDILSFSLESKGHTGVISKNQDDWTFINSGRLDHSINKGSPQHGVGEETLVDEINNWIKLAQKRKESLQITIGRLDAKKLA